MPLEPQFMGIQQDSNERQCKCVFVLQMSRGTKRPGLFQIQKGDSDSLRNANNQRILLYPYLFL